MFARFFVPLALGLLAACSSTADSPMTPEEIYASDEGQDANSYANPEEARVTHVSLDLTADFAAKRMIGSATLDLETAEDAEKLVLDDQGLDIREVVAGGGRALEWDVGEGDEIHGAPLTIQLDGATQVKITYASAPEAAALQWLDAEQTADGEQPFLFSQGEAILNRSWIPTQDSPGIRQTWDARIQAPEGIRVVMSGEEIDPPADAAEPDEGEDAYYYRMPHPVAPYLIAIAAGGLEFRDIGTQSGVWAEPSVVDEAAEEFSDLPRMIDAAEKLYGPYRWGRYDLLVLPPSFPYGGMENPTLTFATPTVLAGDKSLVSLVAHELAHSWSGNLVTNATWNDFWLNEGFTTYFENRIMEEVYGRPAAEMLADLGWSDMMDGIEEAGGLENPATQLHLDLGRGDPDEGTSGIAYEKGAVFLRTVEQAVGRERFDAWLRGYFDRHAFEPQTSEGMVRDMNANLFEGDEAEEIDVHRWIYEPGLPENAVHVSSARFSLVDRAIESFTRGGSTVNVDWTNYTTQERLRFLNGLPRELPSEQLATLNDEFGLNDTGNSEIRFAWLELAIANRYDPAKPSIEQFLTSQGRRKFVAPLFEALWDKGEWGRGQARRIYREARPGYHSVTRGTVDSTLGWHEDT